MMRARDVLDWVILVGLFAAALAAILLVTGCGALPQVTVTKGVDRAETNVALSNEQVQTAGDATEATRSQETRVDYQNADQKGQHRERTKRLELAIEAVEKGSKTRQWVEQDEQGRKVLVEETTGITADVADDVLAAAVEDDPVVAIPKRETTSDASGSMPVGGQETETKEKPGWLAWVLSLWPVGLVGLGGLVGVVLLMRLGFPVASVIVGFIRGARKLGKWTKKGLVDLIKSVQAGRKALDKEARDKFDAAASGVQDVAGIEPLVRKTKVEESIK